MAYHQVDNEELTVFYQKAVTVLLAYCVPCIRSASTIDVGIQHDVVVDHAFVVMDAV
jgi:hypothetical protein